MPSKPPVDLGAILRANDQIDAVNTSPATDNASRINELLLRDAGRRLADSIVISFKGETT
jgi:hypothetical protein